MNYVTQAAAVSAGDTAGLISYFINVHIALAYVTTIIILVIVDETEP